MKAHHLLESSVVYTPELHCQVLASSPELYGILDERYEQFRGHTLLAMHNFTTDWATWEIHPHGDEMVFLVSGEIDLLIKSGTAIECVSLNSPGSFVIVPRNSWHTGRVEVAACCLFMTPGEGTRNAVDPEE